MRYEFLAHHGIKGQKWGIRRYQNPDGTLTPEGIKKYKSNAKKAADATLKASRYDNLALLSRNKANRYDYLVDAERRNKSRSVGLDGAREISSMREERYRKASHRASISAMNYEAHAESLRYQAQRWLAFNSKLTSKTVSSYDANSNKAEAEEFIKNQT